MEMAKAINYSSNRQNNMLWEGWYGETSNATPKEIFLGGINDARFDIEPESVASFKIQIIARDNVNDHGAFYFQYPGMLVCPGHVLQTHRAVFFSHHFPPVIHISVYGLPSMFFTLQANSKNSPIEI